MQVFFFIPLHSIVKMTDIESIYLAIFISENTFTLISLYGSLSNLNGAKNLYSCPMCFLCNNTSIVTPDFCSLP